MSSFCWACGDEVNFIWIASNGDKKCDPCKRIGNPVIAKHRGKLSEMDRLGVATVQASEAPSPTAKDE